MGWKNIERPGVFGDKKAEIIAGYDSEYGKSNWRIVHKHAEGFIQFPEVCKLFEESYLQDSIRRETLWAQLRDTALDVYDIDESDRESGLDYSIQNNVATHIQDIAIRNVFVRRGWEFEGSELVQIRSKAEPFGKVLTPGRVPFHDPQLIVVPHLAGWWDINSVEDFYQSNKVLQVRE